MPKKSVLVALS